MPFVKKLISVCKDISVLPENTSAFVINSENIIYNSRPVCKLRYKTKIYDDRMYVFKKGFVEEYLVQYENAYQKESNDYLIKFENGQMYCSETCLLDTKNHTISSQVLVKPQEIILPKNFIFLVGRSLVCVYDYSLTLVKSFTYDKVCKCGDGIFISGKGFGLIFRGNGNEYKCEGDISEVFSIDVEESTFINRHHSKDVESFSYYLERNAGNKDNIEGNKEDILFDVWFLGDSGWIYEMYMQIKSLSNTIDEHIIRNIDTTNTRIMNTSLEIKTDIEYRETILTSSCNSGFKYPHIDSSGFNTSEKNISNSFSNSVENNLNEDRMQKNIFNIDISEYLVNINIKTDFVLYKGLLKDVNYNFIDDDLLYYSNSADKNFNSNFSKSVFLKNLKNEKKFYDNLNTSVTASNNFSIVNDKSISVSEDENEHEDWRIRAMKSTLIPNYSDCCNKFSPSTNKNDFSLSMPNLIPNINDSLVLNHFNNLGIHLYNKTEKLLLYVNGLYLIQGNVRIENPLLVRKFDDVVIVTSPNVVFMIFGKYMCYKYINDFVFDVDKIQVTKNCMCDRELGEYGYDSSSNRNKDSFENEQVLFKPKDGKNQNEICCSVTPSRNNFKYYRFILKCFREDIDITKMYLMISIFTDLRIDIYNEYLPNFLFELFLFTNLGLRMLEKTFETNCDCNKNLDHLRQSNILEKDLNVSINKYNCHIGQNLTQHYKSTQVDNGSITSIKKAYSKDINPKKLEEKFSKNDENFKQINMVCHHVMRKEELVCNLFRQVDDKNKDLLSHFIDNIIDLGNLLKIVIYTKDYKNFIMKCIKNNKEYLIRQLIGYIKGEPMGTSDIFSHKFIEEENEGFYDDKCFLNDDLYEIALFLVENNCFYLLRECFPKFRSLIDMDLAEIEYFCMVSNYKRKKQFKY